MKKKTTEEFIAEAGRVHGDRYDYELCNYLGSTTKVKIICRKHGVFEQRPHDHLNGVGCRKCYAATIGARCRKTSKQFITEAQEVHGNSYDYGRVNYRDNKSKVEITCPIHGVFLQAPAKHLSGRGCPRCADLLLGDRTHSNTTEFIEKAQKVHGNKYDYSTVTYGSDNTSEITIICWKHGPFLQTPSHHLRGSGCPVCALLSRVSKSRMSIEEFMERSQALHGDRYDYSRARCYSNQKSRLTILCKVHGEFAQTAAEHLNGYGCPKCGIASSADTRRSNTMQFIERAKALHGDKYDYSNVQYRSAQDVVEIICLRHGVFEQRAYDHLAGHGCPGCANLNSKSELELMGFIKALGVIITANDRKILKGKELDILIPNKMLAVEYNGSTWHSDYRRSPTNAKSHMLEKQEACRLLGIRLLHVMDYDNPVAVRKLLINQLGLNDEKVGARKCEVLVIKGSNQNVKDFMSMNHVQGGIRGGLNYCLTYKESIVAVMTFSRALSRRGTKADENIWELRRYATACSVPGGASKLLKVFKIDHPECGLLISYSDNRLFEGGMYEKLGFSLVKELPPDYKYVKGNEVRGKGNFKRSELAKMKGFKFNHELTEVENCRNNRWYRVWDCGKKVWELDLRA